VLSVWIDVIVIERDGEQGAPRKRSRPSNRNSEVPLRRENHPFTAAVCASAALPNASPLCLSSGEASQRPANELLGKYETQMTE
jgi:hypothetical protein